MNTLIAKNCDSSHPLSPKFVSLPSKRKLIWVFSVTWPYPWQPGLAAMSDDKQIQNGYCRYCMCYKASVNDLYSSLDYQSLRGCITVINRIWIHKMYFLIKWDYHPCVILISIPIWSLLDQHTPMTKWIHIKDYKLTIGWVSESR